MLKLGIVGDGNDGIAPLTGCPVPVPTSKPDQYTPVTLLLLQHRPQSPSRRAASDRERSRLASCPLYILSTDLRYIFTVYILYNWKDVRRFADDPDASRRVRGVRVICRLPEHRSDFRADNGTRGRTRQNL